MMGSRGRNRNGPGTGKLETGGQLPARKPARQFAHKQETGLEKTGKKPDKTGSNNSLKLTGATMQNTHYLLTIRVFELPLYNLQLCNIIKKKCHLCTFFESCKLPNFAAQNAVTITHLENWLLSKRKK